MAAAPTRAAPPARARARLAPPRRGAAPARRAFAARAARTPPSPPPPPPAGAATPPAGDWGTSFDPEDKDYLIFLDDLVTRFARAALAGDQRALMGAWEDDVHGLGAAAAGAGHVEGARFAYFLLQLASKKWAPEAASLTGRYLDAATKLHGLLEDAGDWPMRRKGDGEEREQWAAGEGPPS
jgi:hypothetical protein